MMYLPSNQGEETTDQTEDVDVSLILAFGKGIVLLLLMYPNILSGVLYGNGPKCQ